MRKITIKECKELKKEFEEYLGTADETSIPILKTLHQAMDTTISQLNEDNIDIEEIQIEVNNMFDVIEALLGKNDLIEAKPKKDHSKLKRILKNIGYWTWCLPQTLVGLIVAKANKSLKHIYIDPELGLEVEYYLSEKFKGGISLGKYIIVNPSMDDEHTIKHEYGHQLQSFILGPVYLLVIGLPSLIWCNCFDKYRRENKVSYYDFYTEKWANKLAGIK